MSPVTVIDCSAAGRPSSQSNGSIKTFPGPTGTLQNCGARYRRCRCEAARPFLT